jgi:outer membrane autotransporter protein
MRWQVSRVRLQPVVGLRLDTAERGGLTETGAGALSLRVQDGDVTSLRGTVGLRADSTLELGTGYSLTPALRVRWSHELGDEGVQTTSAFAGNPGAGFGQASARPGRDGVDVSVGLNLQMPNGVSAFASYAAESRGNVSGQVVSGGLRYAW